MITQDYKDINDVDKLHNIIQSHESQINILQEQIKSLTDKIYGSIVDPKVKTIFVYI